MFPEIPNPCNIAEVFLDRPARQHPGKVCILGEPEAVTYLELQERMNRFGNLLTELGCRRGDRVLLVLPDSAEFVAAFLGAAKIGAIAVPVNPMTRALDYAFYIADSGARIAVVHEIAMNEFRVAAGQNSLAHTIVAGNLTGASLRDGELLLRDALAGAAQNLAAVTTTPSDPAFFLYTSGSGGRPKAAVHLHRSMLVTAGSYAKHVLGITASDVTFSVSKLFFAYGLGNGLYFPFSVGAATVLNPERPRPERIFELVAKHRPSLFFSVPTIYAALLREADSGVPADFSSVRLAVSAGEALPPEVFIKFQKRFGLAILDGIGSTEMLHMFLSNRSGEARPATVGTEVPNCEAMILDEAGQPALDGEIGSLWVKSASAMAGYWNRPELTAATQRGEWVSTGDKFYRDPDGFYHYCGRNDDMMKVSGMWVVPGEVENALLSHAAVAEAAVVAGTDAVGLTHPVAFVVLQGGAAATPQTGRRLLDHLRAQLPAYKCPQQVHFLTELPKTPTGKTQRFLLRERLRTMQ